MKKNRSLIRQQLQATLDRFQPLLEVSPPPRGWIRAIRDALGMSGRQLAERMGVTRQRTSAIEKQEILGSVKLQTLRRVAEALDCRFVYGFIPSTSLDQKLLAQATRKAKRRTERAAITMALEDQGLSRQENREVLAELVEDLMINHPNTLWDE